MGASPIEKVTAFKLFGFIIRPSTAHQVFEEVDDALQPELGSGSGSGATGSPSVVVEMNGSQGSTAIEDGRSYIFLGENSEIPSLDDFPELAEAIRANNGINPVFLYRKKLEWSDVRRNQNRLFLTNCEKLMEFLTEEEKEAVPNGGLNVSALDGRRGNTYNLKLGCWGKMHIIKAGWGKLVAANNAQKGQKVQIWGYRQQEDGKLAFGVNFVAAQD